MEPSTSKICKMCRKEIDINAKKCPYCQHLQTKMSMIAFHPVVPFIPLIIIFIMIAYFFNTFYSKGENFTPYRDQIEIIETKLKFGEKKCGCPTVVVMGTMINNSDVPWKGVQLEVRFFDSEKELIDTDQEKKYFFVVPANDSSTFKVSIPREFPQEQYGNRD